MNVRDDRLREIRRALRHDLRNPLTIILGRCELLETGLLGELGARQAENVQAIERNAARLVSEIDRIAALMEEVLRDGSGPGGEGPPPAR